MQLYWFNDVSQIYQIAVFVVQIADHFAAAILVVQAILIRETNGHMLRCFWGGAQVALGTS